MRVSPLVMQATAFAAPVGLCVAVRRTRTRDVAVCALQMWAYLAAYETPHDDPVRQAERVHIKYPIVIDRILGWGELPSVRLQRRLAPRGSHERDWRALDRVVVWAHWVWFLVPHTALAYVFVRRPERFPRAAAMLYGVFDIGAAFYWVLPTAPPWYASAAAEERAAALAGAAGGVSTARREPPAGGEAPAVSDAVHGDQAVDGFAVRRLMVEFGEDFWEGSWGTLFDALGGNPLAAMPSLHVGTSVMAAALLTEVGPVAGTIAWGYAAVLCFALIYLGEHYVVDALAGAALSGAVFLTGPRAAPAMRALQRAVAALEDCAHAA